MANKAIFLCNDASVIARVYDAQTRAAISSLCELDETVYSKADVLADPTRFSDVEIAFSSWQMPVFTEEEIKACFPSLKCVFYGAGSVQFFARPFLACGVKVFSAWAANAVPVAEMTVAEIILANKGFFLSSRVFHKAGKPEATKVFSICQGNYGETVGIIGAGMIGKLVINMLKSYYLKVLVFDPFLSESDADALGVEKCSLERLFSESFVVSNHLANNAQTVGMLNYELFKLMRENAVFLNTGRGAQVVEDDLVRILREREDLTALLDVTYPEPPVKDHPFYTLENCILTPHIAGSAGQEVRRMGAYMARELECYLNGDKCAYEVSLEMLKTMA